MAKMVVLITSRIDEGQRLGEAWRAAGAPGVTFLQGYGLAHLQQANRSQGEIPPGMLSMLEILRQNQETSLVMLTLLENDTLADHLLDITETMLGDLRQPNNGVAFIINVERAVGIRDHSPK